MRENGRVIISNQSLRVPAINEAPPKLTLMLEEIEGLAAAAAIGRQLRLLIDRSE